MQGCSQWQSTYPACMKHESQSPVQYKNGKQNNPSQSGFLERYLRIFNQNSQFVILEDLTRTEGWGQRWFAFSLMSPPSGELFSFVSSVFPSPLSQDQFFLRDSFLILGHNTYDLASLLRIRLVCPAVYLYALDGYIKLNLSQVEVINPLFISFNLLGHCLHEEHCCPLHC